MKKVSVIIASYNYGKYISQAIQSLQNQIFKNWECLVVDDGSTDDTATIVHKIILNDQRIKYFQQQNAGPAVARNNGIAKSKGDYILFLDADDLLEINKLNSHVEVLNTQPEVDIAYGDVRYFKENKPGELLFSLRPDNKPWTTKFSGKGNKLVDILLKQNVMVTSAPLIRKEILRKKGGFDVKLFKLEDWELFQRWAINDFVFQYVEAPESHVLMRAHASSFSFDQRSMRNYFLPVLEKHVSQSKLGLKNKLYVFIRMLEEFIDLTLVLITDRAYPPRHYNTVYRLILPILAILFSPAYIAIKLVRLLRNTFQNE